MNLKIVNKQVWDVGMEGGELPLRGFWTGVGIDEVDEGVVCRMVLKRHSIFSDTIEI